MAAVAMPTMALKPASSKVAAKKVFVSNGTVAKTTAMQVSIGAGHVPPPQPCMPALAACTAARAHSQC